MQIQICECMMKNAKLYSSNILIHLCVVCSVNIYSIPKANNVPLIPLHNRLLLISCMHL